MTSNFDTAIRRLIARKFYRCDASVTDNALAHIQAAVAEHRGNVNVLSSEQEEQTVLHRGSRGIVLTALEEYHTDLCKIHFLTAEVQQDLDRLCRKRYDKEEISLQAGNYVLDTMADEDFVRLKSYAGSASKQGFTRRVIRNLLEDFSRKTYGRKRAPAWVNSMGTFWQQLYRLLCLERRADEEIHNLLSVRHAAEIGSNLSISEAIREIKARIPDCGVFNVKESTDHAESWDEVMENTHGSLHTSDDTGAISRTQVIDELLAIIDDSRDSGIVLDRERLLADLEGLGLNDEDRLVLRLICIDNQKIAAVARVLKKPDHQVRRRHAQVLELIRALFERKGLGFEDFSFWVDKHEHA